MVKPKYWHLILNAGAFSCSEIYIQKFSVCFLDFLTFLGKKWENFEKICLQIFRSPELRVIWIILGKRSIPFSKNG
jgi:hypothetical protein